MSYLVRRPKQRDEVVTLAPGYDFREKGKTLIDEIADCETVVADYLSDTVTWYTKTDEEKDSE